ncbi:hypothetical protein [Frigidibacter sp. ROC022]|uniref:hypothetical protein n=1 Tax=Frigidibacter sp. ROC022 TaxID=2971796 RepID=UPI00215A727D|nr:hypothetical protein [Frigidibacter sp. ROC022]MCR8726655.1 hypothetical protein [Frigidibacter sp. ROC022]
MQLPRIKRGAPLGTLIGAAMLLAGTGPVQSLDLATVNSVLGIGNGGDALSTQWDKHQIRTRQQPRDSAEEPGPTGPVTIPASAQDEAPSGIQLPELVVIEPSARAMPVASPTTPPRCAPGRGNSSAFNGYLALDREGRPIGPVEGAMIDNRLELVTVWIQTGSVWDRARHCVVVGARGRIGTGLVQTSATIAQIQETLARNQF